jgi:sugar phosphate isomerase/epimerase
MRPEENRAVTRRDALAAGLSAAGALAIGGRALAAPFAREREGEYGPFKMGLQSYSLRGYKSGGKPDLAKALTVTQRLGLHYWESYPAHVPMVTESDQIARYRDQLKAAGVTLAGYGVVPFTKDHDANRKIFEFGKAIGVTYFSADPKPDSFDSLDKLVEEFGIGVGIHGHGPGHYYAKIDTIAAAIKDHHEKIGCCIDTGHFLRAHEDPVRAVEVFGKRIYGVHLKDVKDATTFTILGQGDLRTADFMRALVKAKYNYCVAIEYEEKESDPEADISACLKEAREVAAALRSV